MYNLHAKLLNEMFFYANNKADHSIFCGSGPACMKRYNSDNHNESYSTIIMKAIPTIELKTIILLYFDNHIKSYSDNHNISLSMMTSFIINAMCFHYIMEWSCTVYS